MDRPFPESLEEVDLPFVVPKSEILVQLAEKHREIIWEPIDRMESSFLSRTCYKELLTVPSLRKYEHVPKPDSLSARDIT